MDRATELAGRAARSLYADVVCIAADVRSALSRKEIARSRYLASKTRTFFLKSKISVDVNVVLSWTSKAESEV